MDAKKLGQIIRSRRKKQGLSIAYISNFITISANCLSRIEQGNEKVQLGQVLKILQNLGLELLVVPREYRDRIEYDQLIKTIDSEPKACPLPYPRIRNLPTEEQGPFREWLMGQTQPGGALDGENDFYYQHDYDRWKVDHNAWNM